MLTDWASCLSAQTMNILEQYSGKSLEMYMCGILHYGLSNHQILEYFHIILVVLLTEGFHVLQRPISDNKLLYCFCITSIQAVIFNPTQEIWAVQWFLYAIGKTLA